MDRISRFVKPRDIEKGSSIKGTYLGSRKMGKEPQQPVFVLKLDSGEILGLNSCQNIQRGFADKSEGDYVAVTSTGPYSTKTGRTGFGFTVEKEEPPKAGVMPL